MLWHILFPDKEPSLRSPQVGESSPEGKGATAERSTAGNRDVDGSDSLGGEGDDLKKRKDDKAGVSKRRRPGDGTEGTKTGTAGRQAKRLRWGSCRARSSRFS